MKRWLFLSVVLGSFGVQAAPDWDFELPLQELVTVVADPMHDFRREGYWEDSETPVSERLGFIYWYVEVVDNGEVSRMNWGHARVWHWNGKVTAIRDLPITFPPWAPTGELATVKDSLDVFLEHRVNPRQGVELDFTHPDSYVGLLNLLRHW